MEINQRYKEYNISIQYIVKIVKKGNSLDNNNIHLNSKSIKDFSYNKNIINPYNFNV